MVHWPGRRWHGDKGPTVHGQRRLVVDGAQVRVSTVHSLRRRQRVGKLNGIDTLRVNALRARIHGPAHRLRSENTHGH